MTARRYFYKDQEIDEADALDDNGIIKDGVTLHYPVYLKDGSGNLLDDGLGQPLPAEGRRCGYVFTTDARAERRLEDRDFHRAELSARYKGGIAAGDHVSIGDRRLEALGYNPENGKLVLADTAELDGESLKEEAYTAYKQDLSDAWKTRPTTDADVGGSCKTSSGAQGTWRKGKDGKVVCTPDKDGQPSDNEFAMAGPLSDAETIRREAWEQSVRDLESAWRR